MERSNRKYHKTFIFIAGLFIALLWASNCYSARTQSIAVPMNKSRLVEIPGSAKKISIGNPNVADILILRSNKIYVLGKELGTTNVIVWDSRGRLITVLDVEVTHDLNALKAKLYEFMPQEKISVYTSQNKLVLSGDVSSAQKIAMAEEIANTFTGSDLGIINLMNVGGSHQIMLEVTVAEVQRSLIREFDSNFVFARNNSNWTWGTVNGGAAIPAIPPVNDAGDIITNLITNPLNIEDNGLFASYLSDSTLFSAAFSIAKTNGLAKILAELH